jgi:hypothetical protein
MNLTTPQAAAAAEAKRHQEPLLRMPQPARFGKWELGQH